MRQRWWRISVAKPEWGVKRACQSCAAKFYDLNRSPITCPKCAAPFDPEALLKSRRSRPAPAKAAKPKPQAAADKESKRPPGDSGDDAEHDDDSGEPAATVLQDASDLGGDGMSEVVATKRDD
jgi:uncharacterized protein (TIGR02300 family)